MQEMDKTKNGVISHSPVVFQKVAGWPSSVAIRRVGDGFQESIGQIQVSNEEQIWALRTAIENLDTPEKKYLEKYDLDGKLILSIAEQEGTKFHSFVVHPSGNLTILELRKSAGDPKKSNLWLKHINSDSKTIAESPLRDRELVDQQHDDTDVVRVDPFLYSARLLANGEGLYLLAKTNGYKLYSFTKDFKLSWNRLVLPFVMLAYGFDVKLALDEVGDVYAGVQLYDESEIEQWEQHFGTTLPKQSKNSNFFVSSFSSNGEQKIARLFGGDHGGLSVAGFAVKNGILTAGCNTRLIKHGSTLDWSIVFLRAEINSGKILDYKFIETQKDTYVRDFYVDKAGHGYFAGVNDFIQVVTGSVVEFGQGYILQVDNSGKKIAYLPLRGPRHTEVKSVRLLGNDRLIFGGFFNGPITHTGDIDKQQTFQWGMLGITKWP